MTTNKKNDYYSLKVNDFLKNGFTVIKSVFDKAEIVDVKKFLEKSLLKNENKFFLKNNLNINDKDINEKISRILADQVDSPLDRETQQVFTGHFSLKTRLKKKILNITKNKNLFYILKKIFSNKDICLHMPPTARFVLPNSLNSKVPPHQDFSYNQHLDDFIVLWLPLVSLTQKRRGLIVYKGSHGKKLQTVKSKNYWFKGLDIKNFKETKINMLNIGDIVLLSSTIIHASDINYSKSIRYSIDYRFFSHPNKSRKHYFDFSLNKLIVP